MVTIRTARLTDTASILTIYAPFVQSTAVSFETIVPSETEMNSRIEKCLRKFPWIVCEINGIIVGYAYGSAHREREAYQWTCEPSIYLDPRYTGKGFAFLLYKALFRILKQQGFVNVYGGITLPNEASIRLHEKCGFELFATYHNVGYKFGSWHKVGWWRLQLNEYLPKPSPPLHFLELDRQLVADVYQNAATAIQSRIKS